MTTTHMPEKVHQGRAVKRIREILQVKQETLASELGISQQSVSLLETKETIDPETIEKIAEVLKVPVDAIKNFDDTAAVNFIAEPEQLNFYNISVGKRREELRRSSIWLK